MVYVHLAGLFASFAEVIPMVHAEAREVVRGHEVHDSLRGLLLDGNAKECGDDVRAEGCDGR